MCLARACPKGRVAASLSESFVGKLCRNRPFSTEARQSASTNIDDKVGNESFGTSSSEVELVALRLVAPRPAAQRLPAYGAARASRSAAARGGVVAARQPLPLNRYRHPMSGPQLKHASPTSGVGAFFPSRRRSGLKPAPPTNTSNLGMHGSVGRSPRCVPQVFRLHEAECLNT